MTKNALILRIAFLTAMLALAPAALAAKGGNSNGKGDPGLYLVTLDSSVDSSAGLPHYGSHVTFDVETTASWPYVTLNCSQNGMGVLTQSAGFWPGYGPGQVFGLSSGSWTGGAADCTAILYSTASNGKSTALASTSFHVDA